MYKNGRILRVLRQLTTYPILMYFITFSMLIALSGCIGETQQRGYIISETALEQVPIGSSRDQVLIVLGTPSTTATLNNEVFYYISQKTQQSVKFLKPQIIAQRVLAVYFDGNSRVQRIANYGLQDGKVFDFVTRTTPTTGLELTFIGQLLKGIGRPTF